MEMKSESGEKTLVFIKIRPNPQCYPFLSFGIFWPTFWCGLGQSKFEPFSVVFETSHAC